MCAAMESEVTFIFIFVIILLLVLSSQSRSGFSMQNNLMYLIGGVLLCGFFLKSKKISRETESHSACNCVLCAKCEPHELNAYPDQSTKMSSHIVEDVDNADVYEGTITPSPLPKTQPYPWSSNQSYSSCYPQQQNNIDFSQNCNTGSYLGIDEANTRLAGLRQRDKRAIDGAVSKNANYYKRHFAKELDEAENKRWWGNHEY